MGIPKRRSDGVEALRALKEWLFAIPLAHVCLTAIYIIGYSSGFGHNISTLFTVDDIFVTGISEMFPIYWITIVLPVIYMLSRNSAKYPFAEDQIEAIADVAERKRQRRRLKNVRRIIGALVVVFPALFLFNAYRYYQSTGVVDAIVLFYAFWIPAGLLYTWWSNHKFKNRYIRDLLEMSVVSICFAYAMGFSHGQRDLKLPYAAFNHRMRCGDLILLSKVGDFNIAVGIDDRRKIIDAECEKVFEIS